jgi:hypothetical protein
VITVTVVDEMPFVVKMALYGDACPVSRSVSSRRIRWASCSPVSSSPRKR